MLMEMYIIYNEKELERSRLRILLFLPEICGVAKAILTAESEHSSTEPGIYPHTQ
jgi:hypothetical protein